MFGGTSASRTAVATGGVDEVASVGDTPNSAVLEAAISEDVELGTVTLGVSAGIAVLGRTSASGKAVTTGVVASTGIVAVGTVVTADGRTNSAVV